MKYAFAFFLAVLTLGCDQNENNSEKVNDIVSYTSELVIKDIFDQDTAVFSSGETVRVSLSIFTNSNSEATLIFNTYQLYDIYIVDEAGHEIWRQSDQTIYKQEAIEFILSARSILTFNEDLDKELFSGGGLKSGSYTLYAFWLGYGQINSAQFNIL